MPKLKHLPVKEKMVTLSFPVRDSLATEATEYAAFVTEESGVSVRRNEVLEGMMEQFMQEDRSFRNWKRGRANGEAAAADDDEDAHDELFEDAVRLVLEFGKASTSLLQRRLRIGYGRAAHLIDLMERDGIVGAADGPRPREVLKRPDWSSEGEQSLH